MAGKDARTLLRGAARIDFSLGAGRCKEAAPKLKFNKIMKYSAGTPSAVACLAFCAAVSSLHFAISRPESSFSTRVFRRYKGRVLSSYGPSCYRVRGISCKKTVCFICFVVALAVAFPQSWMLYFGYSAFST